MQPLVALPICTWRKIPDPRPGTTGCMLYSITARCAYARGDVDMSGVVTLNGGRFPQPMRWNVLYAGDFESSTHQSPQRRRT